MNVKTKVITVLIAAVLVLPAILNPDRVGGEVLGAQVDNNSDIANENLSETVNTEPPIQPPEPPEVPLDSEKVETGNTTSSNESFWSRINVFNRDSSQQPKPAPRQVQIKDISSGIRDIQGNSIPQFDNNQIPRQQISSIKWEEAEGSTITSNTYAVGSTVTVNYRNNSFNLSVTDSRVLSPKTALVVDKNTFISLGGDPDTQEAINAEIIFQ